MRKDVQEIIDRYESYHPNPRSHIIKSAYKLAEILYFGEKRVNEEPWLDHAIRISNYLSKLGLDSITISAGLLHDSLEFGLTYKEIEQEVDPDVAELVQNIITIKEIRGKGVVNGSDGGQVEYLRRLIISTAKDVRAVIIRLVEKLDSLKTVEYLEGQKKQLVLDNALNLYAPLAEQIGLNNLKSDIEDAAFERLDPETFKKLQHTLDTHPVTNDKYIKEVTEIIKDIIQSEKIDLVDYYGRKKRPYSLNKKIIRYMQKFNYSEASAIESIHDKVAFRIILNSVEDCYKVLDLLHNSFKYIPSEFDDYISKPKPNGYKSLQTSLELLNGHFAEVQIRTLDMHRHNEYGMASHIIYKLNDAKSDAPASEKIEVLKRLISWKDGILTTDKSGVNIEEIEKYLFVFTPKGDLFELPKNSTALDFAYILHSDLGHKAVRAKINGVLKPLNVIPKNGDVIEIICDIKKKGPSRDHLEFVVSKEARLNIKKWLRRDLKI
ncbi:bifunctional (p)ppGpp synthetase/guanosine-3',5'-bis(diphosphate) 3'-pyrophosphohydrolase [bacterium]|nr:bifunctional (p)ppGpp synthetase/guanosine-3',5'-bis(diphosphate) 3'-pyrophosphohydrolase [bacterium]